MNNSNIKEPLKNDLSFRNNELTQTHQNLKPKLRVLSIPSDANLLLQSQTVYSGTNSKVMYSSHQNTSPRSIEKITLQSSQFSKDKVKPALSDNAGDYLVDGAEEPLLIQFDEN